MFLNRGTVMGANIDIDTKNFSMWVFRIKRDSHLSCFAVIK